MKKTALFAIAAATLSFAACTNTESSTEHEDIIDLGADDETEEEMDAENDAPESYEMGGLKIYPLEPSSPAFEDAELEMKTPAGNFSQEGGMIDFDFAVENYELGKVTSDADGKGLANSAKGQHIHMIIDNDPYSAHYEGKFQKEMGASGYHYGIAFLSRSYHESVKNKNAYQVFQFYNGSDDDSEAEMRDLAQPMLFYSRPKGEYVGKDTEKVLFDFYMVNGELDPGAHSVKTTINDSLEFVFDTWQPYIIEGLPIGENTISIELMDADGNTVESSEKVTRVFTLKAE